MSYVKTVVETLAARLLFIGSAAILVFLLFTSSAMAANPFLTLHASSNTDLKPFTKWTTLMPRYEQQKAAETANCTTDDCPNVKWEKLLVELQGKSVAVQMREVNKFFNAMTYVSDDDNWGVDDMWNTPYELMTRGGDCEDYAIAKYISLKRLGVDTSQMRIMIVQDENLNGAMHAILEVREGGGKYILDNQAQEVAEESNIFHYRPIYAINNRNWWAYQ